jgi:hypothetical protein
MVGLMQRVLFDLVESTKGAEALSELKERADVPAEKIFRISEVYSADEWRRLLDAAREVLELDEDRTLAALADALCRDALVRFPFLFDGAKSSRELLAKMPAIHAMVASGAPVPQKFHVDARGEELITYYQSPNKLCALYKHAAHWIATHYGDTIRIEEKGCMGQGAERCELHLSWEERSS